MYKIGEFSKLAKTTIKTLRYYEKEGLLIPAFIDENLYRYYDSDQLITLNKIQSLRQLGFSINDIKSIKSDADFLLALSNRKKEIKKDIDLNQFRLQKINHMLKGEMMKYEVTIKDTPECVVYYQEGRVEDFSKISEFILNSAKDCLKVNPQIKCVSPDYCFIEYLDDQYLKNNFLIRYSQAVNEIGKENDLIHFKTLKRQKAVCIYVKGSYLKLPEAYSFIFNYIKENNLKVDGSPRERYIDGVWNKDNEEDYLTEIEVPIL